MNGYSFRLAGSGLHALGSGALWWPEKRLLCVSDLHLGKSERLARRGVSPLPPYDSRETLDRLSVELDRHEPEVVVCLGDSFDDLGTIQTLSESERQTITRLQAGRHWIWIEGNHDPGPVELGGAHLAALSIAPLTFRHIAEPKARAEISGHFHPKVQLRLRGHTLSRPAFLVDRDRVILPAFGTYTGGLRHDAPALRNLMREDAIALVTGPVVQMFPLPRGVRNA